MLVNGCDKKRFNILLYLHKINESETNVVLQRIKVIEFSNKKK